jgi:hypothetical protein
MKFLHRTGSTNPIVNSSGSSRMLRAPFRTPPGLRFTELRPADTPHEAAALALDDHTTLEPQRDHEVGQDDRMSLAKERVQRRQNPAERPVVAVWRNRRASTLPKSGQDYAAVYRPHSANCVDRRVSPDGNATTAP